MQSSFYEAKNFELPKIQQNKSPEKKTPFIFQKSIYNKNSEVFPKILEIVEVSIDTPLPLSKKK